MWLIFGVLVIYLEYRVMSEGEMNKAYPNPNIQTNYLNLIWDPQKFFFWILYLKIIQCWREKYHDD